MWAKLEQSISENLQAWAILEQLFLKNSQLWPKLQNKKSSSQAWAILCLAQLSTPAVTCMVTNQFYCDLHEPIDKSALLCTLHILIFSLTSRLPIDNFFPWHFLISYVPLHRIVEINKCFGFSSILHHLFGIYEEIGVGAYTPERQERTLFL